MAENSEVVLTLDQTLKQRVYALLEKNHELKPLAICKLLDLPKKKADSVGHIKTEWKHDFRSRHSLKCLKFHKARGWIYAFKGLDREAAVNVGWLQSKAKNRMLVWNKDLQLGRLEWFRTGRINAWIRKPATRGKALQLFAKAFMWTRLITSQTVFDVWISTLRFKGAHLTFDTGEKVPYAVIDFLKESNGVVFRAGDVSHPTMYELEFCLPDWQERNEALFQQALKTLETNSKASEINSKALEMDAKAIQEFSNFMKELSQPKPKSKDDRSVV